jgi:hypothetical protein
MRAGKNQIKIQESNEKKANKNGWGRVGSKK